jgi:beta-glucanase (GH16 family)
MEQWGNDKSYVQATNHAGGQSGDVGEFYYYFADATTSVTQFHIYALDWFEDHMVFYVDGNEIGRANYDTSSPFYNYDNYLILNVAIGGMMGGAIDNAGGFPMDMVVDYIRVYQYVP